MRMNGANFKGVVLLIALLFIFVACTNEKANQQSIEVKNQSEIQIIPQPVSVNFLVEGHAVVNNETKIVCYEKYQNEARYLKRLIESASKFSIGIEVYNLDSIPDIDGNIIILGPQREMFKDNSYGVSIINNVVAITSLSQEGIMYGIQTLRQLFVDEFHSGEKRSEWYLPEVIINDKPHFKHRGLLLDCSRHFFSKTVVKKYIDLLALYKMNVLHWHLTEDQGWRIAIDAYPKLTEIGAWRIEKDSSIYGGFYSKEDIREIVSYAEERHVTIIPEIELPGHSQAAIAAYPYLSCTGKQVDVVNDWGVFKEIYCAGNDSVFVFLEQVLTEVMDLFPSEYIHIGGDEAPKYRWEHCSKCQNRIKQEGLKDEHELQRYFISRIETFLNKNGRKLIGWDEILEGGLSPNATVQSWRGMEGGVEAASQGHQAIMSPTSHAYFDYSIKAIDLKKVYEFDPVPEELGDGNKKFIIGGECNMWTEHVPDEANLDSKVFPRLLAMSEVLWSYPEARDYYGFYDRVQWHYKMLENLNVSYGQETLPAVINSKVSGDSIIISVKGGHPDLELRYSWSANGEEEFQVYHHPVSVKESGVFTVRAFKNNKAYGDPVTETFVYHLGLGKTTTYTNTYSEWYTAGGQNGLVNGKIGSETDFRDGNWQGFWGKDLEVVLDLGEARKISAISANFYQYINSWIFIPEQVMFETSLNGNDFKELKSFDSVTDQKNRKKSKESFKSTHDSLTIRYLRVSAKGIGSVPAWHEAAGSDSWIFIDEIIVE